VWLCCYPVTLLWRSTVPSLALDLVFDEPSEDAPSLAQCALVSRGWADPAQRALFGRRGLSITRDNDLFIAGSLGRPTNETIKTSLHVVSYFRQLSLDLNIVTEWEGSQVTILELLELLLGWNLRNLVCLKFHGYTGGRWSPIAYIDQRLHKSFSMVTELHLHQIRLPDFGSLQYIVCSLHSLVSPTLSKVRWNVTSCFPAVQEAREIHLINLDIQDLAATTVL
jgi:hypothetical protein